MVDNRKAIERALRQGAKRAVEDMLDAMVEGAVERCPVDSGDLQRSIDRSQVTVKADEVSGRLVARSPHAAPTEYGSAGRGEPMAGRSADVAPDWPVVPPGKKVWGPYTIRSKSGKMLRWEDESGNEHFAREVTHPGVEAQPFLRPAVDEVRLRQGEGIMQKAFADALKPFVARDEPED